MSTRLLDILQISDSAFPTGGFTHSGGFEAATKYGNVYTTEKFEEFVLCVLNNTGSFNLPFVKAAYEHYGDLQEIVRLDSICEASTTNHVAKRASLRQGRSLIDTAAQVFPGNGIRALQDLLENSHHGHQAVMFGCLAGHLDLSLDETLDTFIFGCLRMVTSSAVRLGHMGPIKAQKLQFQLQQHIPGIINRNRSIGVDDAFIQFPLVDIQQNLHDTMFSKLFYS